MSNSGFVGLIKTVCRISIIFFFREFPSVLGWLGIALVLVALTVLNLQPKHKKTEETT